METILDDFRRRLATAPQPVALALGRVCRNQHDEKSLVEATLKAGEVVARYLAGLAISSYCARVESGTKAASPLAAFHGKLSFGHFLSVVREISAIREDHPLKARLSSALGRKGGGWDAFEALVSLRNDNSHRLATITKAGAQHILKTHGPLQHLARVLKACDPLLELPLFLVEVQTVVKKQIRARRLLLMGESEPTPDHIQIMESFEEDSALYLGLGEGALLLPPFLLWDIVDRNRSYGLYLLHRVDPKKLEYRTIHDDALAHVPDASELHTMTGDVPCPLETVRLKGGGDLLTEWLAIKRIREGGAHSPNIAVDWSAFCPETLAWYGTLLSARPASRAGAKPLALIQDRLLDGRDTLPAGELDQLTILFGKDAAVARTIGRPIVDCRSRRKEATQRWDARMESTGNLLQALRKAVEFFAANMGLPDTTADGLTTTTGTADYIAMREAMINLFIHQDYTDKRSAGSIEIRPDRAVFHNPGDSLVSDEGLMDGGRSTCRNAIISRALRLIGFAELAGSGLVTLSTAWRNAKRRPPLVESSAKANTFTLTLDWRPLEERIDDFWKQKLGVKLTPEQAAILSVLRTPGGFSVQEIASAVDVYLKDARAALQYLKVQGLVCLVDKKYTLRPDLVELAANRKDVAPGQP
jgi:hypothetical protein